VALKAETRVIGIDDGGTQARKRVVVGTVFRGKLWLDGVVSSVVDVRSCSLGRKLAEMVTDSKFYKELRFAMLHGAMLSSAKTRCLIEFSNATKLPTIALLDAKQVRLAVSVLEMTRNAIHFTLKRNVSALCIGLTREEALEILRITSTGKTISEPVRVAGLIASAINFPKRLNWARQQSRAGS